MNEKKHFFMVDLLMQDGLRLCLPEEREPHTYSEGKYMHSKKLWPEGFTFLYAA
jgi:hypothetical protein